MEKLCPSTSFISETTQVLVLWVVTSCTNISKDYAISIFKVKTINQTWGLRLLRFWSNWQNYT